MSRSLSFESPDVEKDFPGLYASERQPQDGTVYQGEDQDRPKKRELIVKKKDKKKDKDKGYTMFEEEDSDEDHLITAGEDIKSPSRGLKKHSKPSFKFAKKDKFIIAKRDKDDKREKDTRKEDKKREDLKEKKRLKKKTKLPPETAADYKPIFGVPLQVAVERSRCHDGIELPAIFRECIDYIEEHGLSCEGIYRISGVKSKIQALKESYNRGRPVYLYEHEPNIVASLLKQYLRELPEPVLTSVRMSKFEEASTIREPRKKVDQFRRLIEELPTPNNLLLSWMIVHMSHIIARAKENKMTLQNVSIVLSPTMQISHRVLNVLFTYCQELFASNCIRRYVPPLKPATSKWSLELPDSPAAIEEELKKQESLLTQLHDEMSRGFRDPEREEQLWEVQRVVTQLKRKLKFVKKGPSHQQQAHPQRAASSSDGDIVLNLELQKPMSGQEVNTAKSLEAVTDVKDEVKEPVEKPKPFEQPGAEADMSKVENAVEEGDQGAGEIEKIEVPARRDSAETETKDKIEESSKVTDTTQPEGEEGVGGTVRPEGEEEEVGGTVHKEDVDEDAGDKENKTLEKPDGQELKSASDEEEDKEDDAAEDSADAEVAKVTAAQLEEDKEEITAKDEVEGAKKDIQQEASPDVEPKNVEVSKKKSDKRVKIMEPCTDDKTDESRQGAITPPQTLPIQGQGRYPPGFGLQSPLKPEILHKTPPRKLTHQGHVDEEESRSKNQAEDSQDGGRSDSIEEIEQENMEDDELKKIQLEYQSLILEEEELLAIADELKKKIEAERNEIERLQMEIVEVRSIRGDSFDADDWSSSDSSYESGDDDELQDILQSLIKENTELEGQNRELCQNIHQERQICLDVKVQIRLIQQQAERYGAGSDSLL